MMVIYSLPNCFRCKFMERWAKGREYDFEVRDLEAVPDEKREEWRNKGFTTAPILEIDGEYSCGSDVAFVEKKMGK